jgi:hypothetical protein
LEGLNTHLNHCRRSIIAQSKKASIDPTGIFKAALINASAKGCERAGML